LHGDVLFAAHVRCQENNDNEEIPMNTRYKIALAILAGAGLGAAAIQGLHAQAKPLAYIVIPILKINDAAGFKAAVVDRANAAAELAAAGGHYVIRGQKIIAVDGKPPERLIVIAFDSVEKAQAYLDTPGQKEVNAARAKMTNSLEFIIEGVAN
jgi:uncharacterized protein (DUF1330 family)